MSPCVNCPRAGAANETVPTSAKTSDATLRTIVSSEAEQELQPLRERDPFHGAGIGLHGLQVDLEAVQRGVVRDGEGEGVGAEREGDRDEEGGDQQHVAAETGVEARLLEAGEDDARG